MYWDIAYLLINMFQYFIIADPLSFEREKIIYLLKQLERAE